MGKKSKTCTYYVQGMHCQACELLIEKKLGKLSHINKADASLSDKTVTLSVQRGHENSIREYNKALEELGYSLSDEPIGDVSWNQTTILQAVLTLIILSIIYLFIKSQGYLAYVSVSETSSLPAFFVFGLVAGVSSCAALVGGLLLSLSKQWNSLYGGHSLTKRSVPFVMFNAGRLISYALFGGLLGLIGSALQLSISATAGLVLAVSLLMIIIGLQMLGVPWVSRIRLQLPSAFTRKMSSAENFQGKYMPFFAGAGTFFLPCGFTLLAQTIALTTGSFTASALIMFMFALGTLPSLAAISFSSIKFQTNPSFAGTFNLIVGILIVAFGLYNINSQLVVLGLPNLATYTAGGSVAGEQTVAIDESGLGSEVIQENGSEIQKAYIRASGFEYFPRSLNLNADIPTRLNIQTENVVGCAQAMYLKGLYDDVVFLNKPQINIEFTPQKGTYYISCSMGMVSPIVVNVL